MFKNGSKKVKAVTADPKVLKDWQKVLKRLAEVEARTGGDTRRLRALERLEVTGRPLRAKFR